MVNSSYTCVMQALTTEEKIVSAAREIFVKKGMSGARMQEIADKAGINKALLHYYFRNKDQLFSAVFQEIIKQLLPQLFHIFKSDLPLEVKVYQVCEKYIDFLKEHRELPLFVLSELQRDPVSLFKRLPLESIVDFEPLKEQLKSEAENGNIHPISLEHFMMNVISMMLFPFMGKPMFERIMGIEDDRYDQILEERKTEVPRFIMNALKT